MQRRILELVHKLKVVAGPEHLARKVLGAVGGCWAQGAVAIAEREVAPSCAFPST